MSYVMSPATESLTIITIRDVPRIEHEPQQMSPSFAHSLDHLSVAQRCQIFQPMDGPTVIRGGWDS